MGQAGGLPLPLGGEAVGDPRRSAQRASDGTTHMRCGECGGPWPRPTHLSLCVVSVGMVGREAHACVEYLSQLHLFMNCRLAILGGMILQK